MAELVLRVLRSVWSVLEPLGVPMAVMGGIAVSLWKHVRATQDVDLLIAVEPADEASLIRALEQAGFRPKRKPAVLDLGALRLLQLLYEPPGSYIDIQVDLMLAADEYPQRALERRVPTHLAGAGLDVAVLTCEDLILHKLIAGRLLDRADVAMLLRGNLPSLDLDYLHEWAGRLGLESDLATLWSEAFPGQSLPDERA